MPAVPSPQMIEEDETVAMTMDTIRILVPDDNVTKPCPIQSLKQIERPRRGANTSLMPPVTMERLVELERLLWPPSMEVIHELVFDPKAKLHYQNIPKGNLARIKQDEEYWLVLKQDLNALCDPSLRQAQQMPRLEILLGELRDMLVYLYPNSKTIREELLPCLDPPFLIQQMRLGTFEMDVLLGLFINAIKSNCAPKRDAIVDHLVQLARNADWTEFFRLVLELMELMMLDLLNYRLCQHRRAILKDFVAKERGTFIRRLQLGHISLAATHDWLLSTFEGEHGKDLGCKTRSYDLFIEETLQLDRGRIAVLRESLQDICIVGCILLIFKQWTGTKLMQENVTSEIKTRVLRLLLQQGANIQDIYNQLILLISRVNGKPVPRDRRTLLLAAVDRIVEPGHEVFKIVQLKVRSLMRTSLKGQSPSDEEYRRAGMFDLRRELVSHIFLAKAVALLNWNVHGEVYRRLVTNLRQEEHVC